MVRFTKAQIQVSESIFIVIFILIIIIFGIVFYSGAQEEETREKRARFAELESIQVAQIASSIPEIQCSLTNVQKPSCFEIEKMDSFINITENKRSLTREYFFSKLGNTRLVVREVYPEENEWVLYNNTLADDVTQSGLPVLIPVSLYKATSGEYHYGVLYITNFQKK
ncbi:MAG: hypothetical protein ACQESE_01135 [Nanobdellota archaeon]